MTKHKKVTRLLSQVLLSLSLILSTESVIAKVNSKPEIVPLLSGQQADRWMAEQVNQLQQIPRNGKREAAAAAFELGKVALKMGESEQADQLFSEAVILNPTSIEYMGFAAEHAFALKRYVKSEQFVLRLIGLHQQQQHPDWSNIVRLLSSLATLQRAQQRIEAARSTLVEARALVRQKQLKEANRERLDRLYKLVELDVVLKRKEDLASYIQEVIALLEQEKGPQHRQKLAESYHNMGEIYRMQQQYSEAEKAYHQAMQLWDQQTDQGKRQAELTRQGLSQLPAAMGGGLSRVYRVNEL